VTALSAAYVAQRLPPTPTARLWAAAGVVLLYLVSRRVVRKVAMQLLRD
jgi:sensor domain CHASE-containing protein